MATGQQDDDQGGQESRCLAGLPVFARPGLGVEIEDGLGPLPTGRGGHHRMTMTGGGPGLGGTAQAERDDQRDQKAYQRRPTRAVTG
ncbi:MAG TPA: hypothetical protein VE198_23240 [Actinoallomurus sp.]|nr:hypothetical protein [Actinoallomurus sp.]